MRVGYVRYVAWLGSKTSDSVSTTIDLAGTLAAASASAGAPATTAVLTLLVGNSTTGLQTVLPVPAGGKVVVTVTEMPIFILVGQGAKAHSGPTYQPTSVPVLEGAGGTATQPHQRPGVMVGAMVGPPRSFCAAVPAIFCFGDEGALVPVRPLLTSS